MNFNDNPPFIFILSFSIHIFRNSKVNNPKVNNNNKKLIKVFLELCNLKCMKNNNLRERRK